MAIEAAVNADGVALVSNSAVVEDSEASRFVKPFDLTVQTDLAHWLVCPDAHLRKAKVSAFWDWLIAEANRMPV